MGIDYLINWTKGLRGMASFFHSPLAVGGHTGTLEMASDGEKKIGF